MMLSDDGLLPGSSKQNLVDLDVSVYGQGDFIKMLSFFND
jgi:hypothetical protein